MLTFIHQLRIKYSQIADVYLNAQHNCPNRNISVISEIVNLTDKTSRQK